MVFIFIHLYFLIPLLMGSLIWLSMHVLFSFQYIKISPEFFLWLISFFFILKHFLYVFIFFPLFFIS